MNMYFTCWELEVEAGELEVVAVMIPPVILKVVLPGLDKCAAVTVFTDPSDSFTWEPWEPPTTCQSNHTPWHLSQFWWNLNQ